MQLLCDWVQLYETFTDLSTHFRNLYVILKYVPSYVPKDHELNANEEQNYSEPILELP